ncbi:hypothetical protein ACH5RR_004845 [Cinchona calisaya]|uniref:SANTA domain-containing protein n=1 Tax=Cinchona calisaya TaxID=153742 RepID=A0ABD3AYR6_9GENT
MATPTNPSTSSISTPRSYFQTTVRLNDWWLVKAEKDIQGKRLAVAGILHREQQALRVFSSAPILKRRDLFNLETADGVWIIIKGLINKARTEENGFPSEVFDHFICGFPPYWEKYALNCFEREPSTVGAAQSNLDSEKLSPEAGTMVPVTMDFSVLPQKNCENASSEEAEDDNWKENSSIKDSPAGGKNENRSYFKSGEATHSVARSQQNSGPVVKFPSTDSPSGDNPALAYMDPEASEKEPSPGNSSIEHMEALELSGHGLDDNVTQPLAQSGFEEKSVPPSDQDNMSIDGDGKQGQNNECIRKRASKVMHSPSEVGGVENKRQRNAGAESENTKAGSSRVASVAKQIKSCSGCHTTGAPLSTGGPAGPEESHVTPKKKEESSIASPESLSLRRSRSGRLLVPTMQFWRNQRAVYDADRRITGIKDPQLNQPIEGSRSEPQRKKKPQR